MAPRRRLSYNAPIVTPRIKRLAPPGGGILATDNFQLRTISMARARFIYGKEKKGAGAPEGANWREEALRAGARVYEGRARYPTCRALGLGGPCRVLVKQGGEQLSPKSRRERFRLALS